MLGALIVRLRNHATSGTLRKIGSRNFLHSRKPRTLLLHSTSEVVLLDLRFAFRWTCEHSPRAGKAGEFARHQEFISKGCRLV